MTEKKVEVEIDGVSYTLITDENINQVLQVSDYVNKKIREVKEGKLSYDRQLVLASINIANDLFTVGHKYEKLKKESREPLEKYPSLYQDHKNLIDANKEYEEKLEKLVDENMALKEEKENMQQKILASEKSNQTISKLREELAKIQKEAASLRAENNHLKGSI